MREQDLLDRVKQDSFPVPGGTRNETSGLRLTALPALLAEPPEEVAWQWDGLLITGGTSVIVGKPKSGKSTIARQLAIQTAMGRSVLGRDCQRGPVIYIGIEEQRSRLAAIYRQMPDPHPDDLYLHIGPPPQNPLDALQLAITELKPVLVIIDPVLKFISVKDSNDYAVMSAALAPIEAIARQSGTHIAMTHHMGKTDRDDGDQILGSTAILAAVDTALVIRRSDTKRQLSSIQRFGDDLEPQIIELDEHGLLQTGGSVENYEVRKAAESIVAWLEDNTDAKEPEIRAAVEGKTKTLSSGLRWAVEQKQVTRTGAGKSGSPYRYSISQCLVPRSPVGEGTGNELKQDIVPPSVNHVGNAETQEDETLLQDMFDALDADKRHRG